MIGISPPRIAPTGPMGCWGRARKVFENARGATTPATSGYLMNPREEPYFPVHDGGVDPDRREPDLDLGLSA